MFEQLPLFDIEETEAQDGDYDTLGPVFLRAGSCPACYVGSHSDCYSEQVTDDGNEVCCCKGDNSSEASGLSEIGEGADLSAAALSDPANRRSTIDRIKDASAVTDVTSTGRKRAALAYPLTEGMICEWQRLAKAGGGVRPIIGCSGNPAKARHHGPDKNTLNNTEGNVHRICHDCHNRWHAANDQFYGKRPPGTEPFIPLDGNNWVGHNGSDLATDEDILNNEIYWRTNKPKKISEGADS